MSAYAALLSLLQTLEIILDRGGLRNIPTELPYLVQILISYVDSDGPLSFYSRAQLRSLRKKVILLLDFLDNSSSLQASQISELETKMREAAYKADNILKFPRSWFGGTDIRAPFYMVSVAILAYVLIEQLDDVPSSLIPGSFQEAFLLFVHFMRCLSMVFIAAFIIFVFTYIVRKVRELVQMCGVLNDFETIVRQFNEIRAAGDSDQSAAAASSKQDAAGDRGKNVVVGLGRDMERIKLLLTGGSTQLETVSIVGMGGIGKTTLATQLYNDPYIVNHFDIRVRVTVSQEYSFRSVLLCLLGSANRLTKEMQETDVEDLALHLHQTLMNRRYLIVMDDVWDTEITDFIGRFSPDNINGSRVLLTSRLLDVARRSDYLHQMQCLSDDESWNLLRKVAFGEEDRCPHLETIGRRIARNCRGLPLATVVIGGLLRKNSQTEMWEEIATRTSRQTEDECLEILGLSYKHLPHYLRPCFLYMGVFPGDYEITVSRLIRLWVAEGILRQQATKSLEEVAEGYLNDLVDRHMILACKRSSSGKIKTCRMHDLLREVCVINARNQNFLHVVGLKGFETPQRLPSHEQTPQRLSIHPDAPQGNAAREMKHTNYYFIRSFLYTSKLPREPFSMHLYFPFLQVLDALVVQLVEFPQVITRLVHLKYVALFCINASIPPSISKLHNLQTLVYQYPANSRHMMILPDLVLWIMPNLRHLYVKPGSCFEVNPLRCRLPQNGFFLEHIQTLVGLTNFIWSREITKRMPNLKKLGVYYRVASEVEWLLYHLEFLVDLHQLETLNIAISKYDYDDPPELVFPQKLKKLTLSGCGISWKRMAVIAALPNLEELKLRNYACCGPSWTTVEGGFPQLKFLLLENLFFAHWETEADHFPRLQRLVIRSCIKLQEIPSSIGEIPTLEMIELVDCLLSAVDSATEIQQEQENMGNEDLKVRIGHIPY